METVVLRREQSRCGALVSVGLRLSYGADLKVGARRIATQIAEILNVRQSGRDMPFFLETRWELIINLKSAKELGLEIPAELVARADRIIE